MRKPIGLTLLLAVFSMVLISQTCSKRTADNLQQTTSAPIPVAAAESQWEYLIASFGKTYFSSPAEVPEITATGLSKLVGYSQLGLGSVQEAPLTQSQMDKLGKFGWELVGIVGAIGGDQQMVFKRRFDPEQSKKEAELVRQEGDKLLAAKKQEEERLVKLAANPAQELLELDQYEKDSARAKTRQNEEMRLNEALGGMNDPRILSIAVSSTADNPNDSEAQVKIVYNGTEELLKDGNKYRKSEAEKLALGIARRACAAAKLKGTTVDSTWAREINITVNISINYQGRSLVVASGVAAGNWPDRRILY